MGVAESAAERGLVRVLPWARGNGYDSTVVYYSWLPKPDFPAVKLGAWYFGRPSDLRQWVAAWRESKVRKPKRWGEMDHTGTEGLRRFAGTRGLSYGRLLNVIPEHLIVRVGEHGGRLRVRVVETERWLESMGAVLRNRRYLTDDASAFATEVGSSREAVTAWKRAGLPLLPDGTIDRSAAIIWLSERRTYRHEVPHGCEIRADFGRRIGSRSAANHRVSVYVAKGMPTTDSGHIPIYEALCWIVANTRRDIPREAWPAWVADGDIPAKPPKPIRKAVRQRLSDHSSAVPDGCESLRAFTKRNNTSQSTVLKKMVLLGLKVIDGPFGLKYVRIAEANRFLLEVWPQHKWKRLLKAPPDGCLTGVQFCLLFSCSHRAATKKFADLRRRGLPIRTDGFVEIAPALRWVRDNTKIPIAPDEEADEMPVMGVASWGRK